MMELVDLSDIEDDDGDIDIRDGQNPFELYNDEEFKRRYRFRKDSILYGVLPKIEEGLARINNRGLPISPVMHLLICLRYYATASFQLLLGDTMTVSQPTISRVVLRVSLLNASLMNDYIKTPRDPEARIENQRLFNNLGKGNGAIGLPGVDGAIDCTHIRLTSTKFQNMEEIYRNREGYLLFNVQAVVGPRMEFLDIVPEWPGSAHDSRIFRNSRLYMRCMKGEFDGMPVGDSGYSCLLFLMTPLRNPEAPDEFRYNYIQIRTRLIVQRTFGVWKRRFPCLSRDLTTKLICSTTTVVACAVLHNLTLIFNYILPEENEIEDNDEEIPLPNVRDFDGVDGFAAREALIVRMFN